MNWSWTSFPAASFAPSTRTSLQRTNHREFPSFAISGDVPFPIPSWPECLPNHWTRISPETADDKTRPRSPTDTSNIPFGFEISATTSIPTLNSDLHEDGIGVPFLGTTRLTSAWNRVPPVNDPSANLSRRIGIEVTTGPRTKFGFCGFWSAITVGVNPNTAIIEIKTISAVANFEMICEKELPIKIGLIKYKRIN